MSLKENGCPGEGSQIPNAVVYHDRLRNLSPLKSKRKAVATRNPKQP